MIENVLYTHPAILEAAVVGEPDTMMGEVPVGYVALRPGMDTTIEELAALCRRSLAKYKQPQEIKILPSLPKNSVGKLVRGMLRNVASPAHSNEYAAVQPAESARS